MTTIPRSGKFFKLLQTQLDDMKAGGAPKYAPPLKPKTALSPVANGKPEETTPSTTPAKPAVAPKPGNVTIPSASLMRMAYSPSPTKSPTQAPTFRPTTPTTPTPEVTRSPSAAKLVAPTCLTSNSQDIKKKFDSLDLDNNKFRNKGSFYSRFNVSPESPTPPAPLVPTPPTTPPTSGTKSSSATPPATPPMVKSSVAPIVTPPAAVVKSSTDPMSPSVTSPGSSSVVTPKRGSVRQTPVRPSMRPITPPPEDVPNVSNVPNVTSVVKTTPSKYNSTCTSPLPKYHTESNLVFSKSKATPDNETPVRPKMVSLVEKSLGERNSQPVPEPQPEATKQSPSLAKLMYGGKASPTFNSPDRTYKPGATTTTSPLSNMNTNDTNNTNNTTPNKSPVTNGSPTTPNGGTSPGGGKILCAPKPILLPICKSCHQEIRGPYVGAQGRAWHSEHFVCSVCDGDLSQGFKEVEDKLYCGTCYFENFGERCANCGNACVGAVIQALGKSYHPEHFTCFDCGIVLTEGFNVDKGNPYCKNCHTNYMPVCAGCNIRIEGASQWISALDKDWHNGCFTCTVCKAPLAGNSFFHDGAGNALCQVHARNANRVRVQ